MSNKKTQFELAGDYRIDRRQNIRLSYEYEKIDRWCDSSLSNNARGAGPGGAGGIAAYYTTASCVEVPDSKENKLLGNYRLKATEDVSVTAGLAYAKRQADVNSGFYNPMQASNQGYELPAYRAFFDASRTEQLAKAGVNWQASEKLNVTLGSRYTHDNYDDSTLGVQEGHSWSANLDGTYSLAEKSTVSAYLSVQKRQRDLLNGVWSHATATFFPPPAQTWLNTLDDNDTTFGLTVKQGDLMGGKLNLVGDLTYSVGKSTYSTSLNYTAAACTLSAPQTGGQVCGTLPDISSKLLQFKLTGDYALDKASKIVMGYIYQRLNSDDYYYNAYQMGYTATAMLPTNQQNPSYSASTLFAAYNYSFR
jgi:MtrB/PioB family decaheme-associated outer membrane protein